MAETHNAQFECGAFTPAHDRKKKRQHLKERRRRKRKKGQTLLGLAVFG